MVSVLHLTLSCGIFIPGYSCRFLDALKSVEEESIRGCTGTHPLSRPAAGALCDSLEGTADMRFRSCSILPHLGVLDKQTEFD